MDQAQTSPSDDKPELDPATETPMLQNLARVIRSSLAEHQTRSHPVQAPPEPEADPASAFAATVDSVRRASETLRAAEQRSNDLQAGLQALTERARREINAAEQRARDAQDRAEAAEERARSAEERLAHLMELIQREFAAALAPERQAAAASAA